jgi:hypothetical protein
MSNARDDHETAQNKTQYIKQQEEECHLPGVSQKGAALAGEPPLFLRSIRSSRGCILQCYCVAGTGAALRLDPGERLAAMRWSCGVEAVELWSRPLLESASAS